MSAKVLSRSFASTEFRLIAACRAPASASSRVAAAEDSRNARNQNTAETTASTAATAQTAAAATTGQDRVPPEDGAEEVVGVTSPPY
ncbi:hypothetical protein RhoFasK5_02079|nr:hypothetical protein [Rhodococcus kroppenstedtii]